MDAYPILAEKGHASVGAYPILAEKGHASTSAYPILAEKGHASMGAYPILAEKGHAALGNGSSAVLAGFRRAVCRSQIMQIFVLLSVRLESKYDIPKIIILKCVENFLLIWNID